MLEAPATGSVGDMTLRVLTANIQIADHPHNTRRIVLGVFDQTDEQMIQLIGEAGAQLYGERFVLELTPVELNKIRVVTLNGRVTRS